MVCHESPATSMASDSSTLLDGGLTGVPSCSVSSRIDIKPIDDGECIGKSSPFMAELFSLVKYSNFHRLNMCHRLCVIGDVMGNLMELKHQRDGDIVDLDDK